MTDVVDTPMQLETAATKPVAIATDKYTNHRLLLKVNTLNLHKLIKGILVHNGYFFVADIMKHF